MFCILAVSEVFFFCICLAWLRIFRVKYPFARGRRTRIFFHEHISGGKTKRTTENETVRTPIGVLRFSTRICMYIYIIIQVFVVPSLKFHYCISSCMCHCAVTHWQANVEPTNNNRNWRRRGTIYEIHIAHIWQAQYVRYRPLKCREILNWMAIVAVEIRNVQNRHSPRAAVRK